MKTGALCVALSGLVITPVARAAVPQMFGASARSSGLSRSNVADADGGDAPELNPAAAASSSSALRVGYGYGAMSLSLGGREASVENVAGFSMAANISKAFGKRWNIGGAIWMYAPDSHLAELSFRPGSEPQFVRYEAPLQRGVCDFVGAIRYRWLSLGAGAAFGLDLGGGGTGFTFGQDAKGAYASGRTDIAMPYRLAPLVGAAVDLGRARVGIALRGSTAVDFQSDNAVQVNLVDNPLNGTTRIQLRGTTAYDPLAVSAGVAARMGPHWSAFTALEYAAYSRMPPPIANVIMDVRLQTVPSAREVAFVLPRWRDTLSPRVGFEYCRERVGLGACGVRIYAGYSFVPSPVPAQSGLTSFADAPRHGLSLGAVTEVVDADNVTLSIGISGSAHVLAAREETKANSSLPYAHYNVAGHIFFAALIAEARWR